MKSATLAGAILIAIGVIALAYQGITYTTQKKVLDVGPLHATKEESHTISLLPVLGVFTMMGGAVVMFVGRKN